jgi:hypothetical protein
MAAQLAAIRDRCDTILLDRDRHIPALGSKTNTGNGDLAIPFEQ